MGGDVRRRVRALERKRPGADGECRCGRVRVVYDEPELRAWHGDRAASDQPEYCPDCGGRVTLIRVIYDDSGDWRNRQPGE